MSLDVYLVIKAEVSEDNDAYVYEANITHNLGRMASEAGKLYKALWRPEELGAVKAKDIIKHLERGLNLLKSDPEKYKKLNPSNGWGDYEGLVRFTENYLKACKDFPEIDIYVSR